MLRFHIRVNTGDKDITKMYWFVHKQWSTLSEEEQAKELNHIYKDYGRFATSVGVHKFFDSHGFEITVPQVITDYPVHKKDPLGSFFSKG